MGDEVRDVFDEVVYECELGIGVDEWDGLFVFFLDVFDDFLEFDFWVWIVEVEIVVVECFVDGFVLFGDVEIEVYGEVDFFIVFFLGEIYVIDVKVFLIDLIEEI